MKPSPNPPAPRLLAAALLAGAAQGAIATTMPPESELPTPRPGGPWTASASSPPKPGGGSRPGAHLDLPAGQGLAVAARGTPAPARPAPAPAGLGTPVPEPSTTALTLLGGVALLAWRRLTRARDRD